MDLEQARKANERQDANSKVFRERIGLYCEPTKDPLAEKLATITGEVQEVAIGDGTRKVSPKVDVLLVGDSLVFAPQYITEPQLRKLLDPNQKGALTRAMKADTKSRVGKLNAQKS